MSRVITEVVEAKSDLTNKPATEVREFEYAGVRYKLDLTDSEAGVFDRTLAKYTTKASVTEVDPSVLREWARKNGYEVGERGRLSSDLQDAFAAASRGESVNGHEAIETVDA